MRRESWISAPLNRASSQLVPDKPGVYAMLEVERFNQLPCRLEVVYIGQAGNLRRRFLQHIDPIAQRNSEIFELIKQSLTSPEFWFLRLERSKLDEVERRLIGEIAPRANNILYGSHAHE